MAIVKMKHLRLVAMQDDREEILHLLQRKGCVEIDEPQLDEDQVWEQLSHPEGDGLSAAQERKNQAEQALTMLKKYAPEKGGLLRPRPMLTEKQFFGPQAQTRGEQAVKTIHDIQKDIASLQAQKDRLTAQRAVLAPWLSLDLPLETQSTREVSVCFGTVSALYPMDQVRAALEAAGELAELTEASTDREYHYVLLICHTSMEPDAMEALKRFGWSRANLRDWQGTAAENDRRIGRELEKIEKALKADEQALAQKGELRETLRQVADRANVEIEREQARARLLDTQTAFCLEGWIPADAWESTEKLLRGRLCAYEVSDPTPEEYPQTPVQLKNGRVTRSMNVITEMYSMPAYDGIDPNPLMAPFFIVFFGMIMADMGYGLLMVIASALVLSKQKPKNPYFMEMIFWCGLSTIAWGAATGGFFGDMIPQFISMLNPDSKFEMPSLFTPLDDIVPIMIGSLVMGLIQVITGMTVSVVKKTKDGEFLDALFDEISWWIILAGLGLFVCSSMVAGLPAVLGTVGTGMLVVGLLMLAIGGTRKEKGFAKFTSFGGAIYNGVTGFFSDILSYIRLMALMVSGSVIASVFNTLAATTGNVVTFVLISLLGNALNLALSLLGAYVHDLRLQCLEFFGRFYKEGGKPYQPLSFNTQYIDVIKEEN